MAHIRQETIIKTKMISESEIKAMQEKVVVMETIRKGRKKKREREREREKKKGGWGREERTGNFVVSRST